MSLTQPNPSPHEPPTQREGGRKRRRRAELAVFLFLNTLFAAAFAVDILSSYPSYYAAPSVPSLQAPLPAPALPRSTPKARTFHFRPIPDVSSAQVPAGQTETETSASAGAESVTTGSERSTTGSLVDLNDLLQNR